MSSTRFSALGHFLVNLLTNGLLRLILCQSEEKTRKHMRNQSSIVTLTESELKSLKKEKYFVKFDFFLLRTDLSPSILLKNELFRFNSLSE